MLQKIQSQRVVTPEGVLPATIAHEDGVILSVEPFGSGEDFGELYILPGLVDTHVHINEPGRTEWEGFRTATRAAAAGGFTCVVDMPLNSIPATNNVPALEQKRESAVGQCITDYAFWGGVVPGNARELKAMAEAGVRGFKCFMAPSGVAEFEMVVEADLREAMPVIAQTGLPLLVHAELPTSLKVPARGDYASYLASRPPTAELEAIQLLIQLCREFRCRIHIVHLASAEPLPIIVAAKAEGLPITVETCPHYLYFSAEQIPAGATQFKCAPPIREAETRDALRAALREGAIDLVATDHSPCPPELKKLDSGDFSQAWGGIASLSLALSAMFTAGFAIDRLTQWMSARPAQLAGLHKCKGSIAPGFDADFVVFDPDACFTVGIDDLHFRHPVTPYLGERMRGSVKRTYVRGECVYRNGELNSTPIGRECKV